jgi:hypothetical protein
MLFHECTEESRLTASVKPCFATNMANQTQAQIMAASEVKVRHRDEFVQGVQNLLEQNMGLDKILPETAEINC